MKHFLKDYFTYNRRERRGVIILLVIISLLLLYLTVSKYFINEQVFDFSAFEKEVNDFENTASKNDSLNGEGMNYQYAEHDYQLPVQYTNPAPERFEFDPNGLPEKEWKRLGLSDKQVNVIKNYEAKGGKFRKKEDVKKMYCITPELYASLEPYIRISKKDSLRFPSADGPVKQEKNPPANKPAAVELNTADSLQLDQLKGIGFSFARRIINYRQRLGGYVRKEQLLEVYGFSQEKLDQVAERVYADSSLVIKLNINTVPEEDLKKHPYIKYNLARVIINYRKQHGPYHTLSDLRRLDLVNDELYRKIAPYLKTE